MKTVKKLTLILFFFSTFTFGTTCIDEVCMEFVDTLLPIPKGYILDKNEPKRGEVLFSKIKAEGSISVVRSNFIYGNRDECGIFCDENTTKIIDRHQEITTYTLTKSYADDLVNAKLWRLTSISYENRNEIRDEGTIGVIYSKGQLLVVFSDNETWNMWVNKLRSRSN